MKQKSNILLCLGNLYCLIIVINAKPEPEAKKNSEIFDYGCPCGERDVTEEEVCIEFFILTISAVGLYAIKFFSR